jgi:hypothetical protein
MRKPAPRTIALEHPRLLAMIDAQVAIVERRFADRGLCNVAQKVREAAAHAPEVCLHILKPNLVIRGGVLFLALSIVVLLLFQLSRLEFGAADGWAVLEGIEAAIGTAVYTGVAIFFLVSIELRRRRQRALEALQELRALAHVLDMHQTNKDPERFIFADEAAFDNDNAALTPFLLERYLDYTADLLSMIGKLAAWYAQQINDAEVLAAVNEIEQLTVNLSTKIWQKIQVVNQVYLFDRDELRS